MRSLGIVVCKSDVASGMRESALELFLRHGYHGVSIRTLCGEMGIQPGSFYYHYESKQELLFEMIEDYESRLCAGLLTQRSMAPMAMLSEFVNFYVGYVGSRRAEYTLALHEYRNLEEENQREIDLLRNSWLGRLSFILKKGADSGLFTFKCERLIRDAALALMVAASAMLPERQDATMNCLLAVKKMLGSA